MLVIISFFEFLSLSLSNHCYRFCMLPFFHLFLRVYLGWWGLGIVYMYSFFAILTVPSFSFMLQKLFSLIDQTSVPDNPDSLQNQEVLLPGHLITIYLKVQILHLLSLRKMLLYVQKLYGIFLHAITTNLWCLLVWGVDIHPTWPYIWILENQIGYQLFSLSFPFIFIRDIFF